MVLRRHRKASIQMRLEAEVPLVQEASVASKISEGPLELLVVDLKRTSSKPYLALRLVVERGQAGVRLEGAQRWTVEEPTSR